MHHANGSAASTQTYIEEDMTLFSVCRQTQMDQNGQNLCSKWIWVLEVLLLRIYGLVKVKPFQVWPIIWKCILLFRK
jgi:hypothetical protein